MCLYMAHLYLPQMSLILSHHKVPFQMQDYSRSKQVVYVLTLSPCRKTNNNYSVIIVLSSNHFAQTFSNFNS